MDTLQNQDFWRYTSYMTNKYGHGKEFSEKDMDHMLGIREQLWPLRDGVKISCNIPVCGHQEQKNIYRCLSCFAQQKPETHSTFEVNLLVNSPKPTEDNAYSWGETRWEIERFKKEHPKITVNVAYFRFQWKFDIGLMRSHLNDARMLDISDSEKHLFASYDADMVDMPWEYMERIPHFFQKPEHQLLVARSRDSDTMLCYFPANNIAWYLRQLLWEKLRRPTWRNMIFRVSAYNEVWWYQKTHGKAWEDGALGWEMRKKFTDKWVRQWNSVLTVTSDARREVHTLLGTDGKMPPHGLWKSRWPDGSIVKNEFWHEEPYRGAEFAEDLTLLRSITSDENAWREFLRGLSDEMKNSLVSFFKNQMERKTLWKNVDVENSYIPKKWAQAMKILWIEKWNINVSIGSGNQTIPSIDLQILEAESLKEKLKRFIADKEK